MSEGPLAPLMRAQRRGRRQRELHHETARTKIASELLAKQRLHIGLVVDDENENVHASPSCLGDGRRARQHDPEIR